jgi:dolichol kinase
MRSEILRQIVHLSGLASVAIAQLSGRMAAASLFFLVALFFLAYTEYIARLKKAPSGLLHRMESRFRGFALLFERKGNKKPFLGPFWFYIGLGLSFLIFPLKAATAAGAVLSVSDALSTIVGVRFGRRSITGSKTLEGTAAFFVSSLLICLLWFSPWVSLLAALAATFAEMLPCLVNPRLKSILDDNLLIPIVTGLSLAVMM